jgi:hypothetical protein
MWTQRSCGTSRDAMSSFKCPQSVIKPLQMIDGAADDSTCRKDVPRGWGLGWDKTRHCGYKAAKLFVSCKMIMQHEYCTLNN